MSLAKGFAIVASVSLLLAAAIGSTIQAEEAEEPLARNWGCVAANIEDNAEGAGELIFIFVQNGKKVERLGYYFFFWNAQNFAEGPTSGSISRSEVNFDGVAGDGCTVSGSGEGHEWTLSGEFKFHGECAKFFEGGTFSIVPGICAGSFEKTKGIWQANN